MVPNQNNSKAKNLKITDKTVNQIMTPKSLFSKVTLSNKYPVYPKQPKKSSELIGLEFSPYNTIIINWKSFYNRQIEMKFLFMGHTESKPSFKVAYMKEGNPEDEIWWIENDQMKIETLLFRLVGTSSEYVSNVEFDIQLTSFAKNSRPALSNDI